MSTRTDATYDDATTTSPRTDPTTDDFSTQIEDTGATADDARRPHEGIAWSERCKRQFDSTSTTRMQNLNDDANAAMHDGV